MPQFIDEYGELKTEVIKIFSEYQDLPRERKLEILELLRWWLESEEIKLTTQE